MSETEGGVATRVRLAPSLPRWIRRALETVVGAALFLLVLQGVLGFYLLEPGLWILHERRFWVGIVGTLRYVAFIIPVSLGIGFALGWARVSRFRSFAWPASAYIEFFRGIPPIILIIFAFVLGPQLFPQHLRTVDLSLAMGALAIAFHSAAFQAEIFRAGFQSVPRGQVEAAQSIGMEPIRAMQYVVLPQAFRLSLPPLANEFAVVIKDTSLMALVSGFELFHLSQLTQERIARGAGELEWIFSVWTSAAVVYFVLTFAVTRVMLVLERRYHSPGLEGVSI